MNKRPIRSSWTVVKGKVRKTWSDLTDDDLDRIDDEADRRAGTMKRRSDRSQEDVWRKPSEWQDVF